MGQSRWKKITQPEETLKKYLETMSFLGRRVKELGMQIVFPSIFAVNNQGTTQSTTDYAGDVTKKDFDSMTMACVVFRKDSWYELDTY